MEQEGLITMAKFVNGVKKVPTLLLKRLPIFLLKVVYILPFLLFGVWLLTLVYFPHELPHESGPYEPVHNCKF